MVCDLPKLAAPERKPQPFAPDTTTPSRPRSTRPRRGDFSVPHHPHHKAIPAISPPRAVTTPPIPTGLRLKEPTIGLRHEGLPRVHHPNKSPTRTGLRPQHHRPQTPFEKSLKSAPAETIASSNEQAFKPVRPLTASLVREIASHNGDVSRYVPPNEPRRYGIPCGL